MNNTTHTNEQQMNKKLTNLTMDDIKREEESRGSYWFSKDSMEFFDTKLCGNPFVGPGGVYFVTSDKLSNSPRGYTIRSYNPKSNRRCAIETVGDFCGFKTLKEVRREAKRLAMAENNNTSE